MTPIASQKMCDLRFNRSQQNGHIFFNHFNTRRQYAPGRRFDEGYAGSQFLQP